MTVVAAEPSALHELVGDEFARLQVSPAEVRRLWVGDGAALWEQSRDPGVRWWTTVGTPEAVARVVERALDEAGAPAGGTFVRGSIDLIPGLRMTDGHDWEWMRTYAPPAPQPGEERVRGLDELGVEDAEIVSLLERDSPRHSARPGDADLVRWCGIVDDHGLAAVVAETTTGGGYPHLASVATRADARGQGLGGAVTAWITRALLAEGRGAVTLGMYSDNDVARRLYHRLGYACDHFFTSGPVTLTR